MKKIPYVLLLAGSIFAAATTARAEVYDLTVATSLYAPSFRGQADTTWFGWNEGKFFGSPVPSSGSRVLNNSATSNGTIGLTGVEFYQNDRASGNFTMIGSSAGNIYTGSGPIGKQAAATLVAPMAAGGVDGYSTIVIQGRTTTAGGPATIQSLLANYPVFSSINGVSPSFVISANAANQGQWWAQYEIPGYASLYSIGLTFPGGSGTAPISIAALTVDTHWSATGYVNVSAVPEPGTWALGIGGLLAVVGWRVVRAREEQASQ